ncbi:S-layer homology domain-containing protein [Cohnella fermenti]|uniref:SLH domain-containing protein n=1 Tax=Cohnella fermenti TaxID=2565925 RepID=A0A4S4BJM0_9BACL|nr:S-layer homology domain-containing protein [Cohnella fermenti]THF74292.1 hypothetical protein E6C55_25670 [Cohnella fermenti]
MRRNMGRKILLLMLAVVLLASAAPVGAGSGVVGKAAAAGDDVVRWEADFSNIAADWYVEPGLTATANGAAGVQMAVNADADPAWQKMSALQQLSFDMEDDPKLAISVADVQGGSWSVKASDGTQAYVLTGGDRSDTGEFVFPIAEATGWTGVKSFTLELWAIGAGSATTIDQIRITGANPAAEYPIWEADLSNLNAWVKEDLVLDYTDEGGLRMQVNDTADPPYQKMTTVKRFTVDMAAGPILKLRIGAVDPGGSWSVKLEDSSGSDIGLSGDQSTAGSFAFDIPDATGWDGTKTFAVSVWGIGGGKSVTIDSLQLVSRVPVEEEVEQQTDDPGVDSAVPTSAELRETGELQRRDLSLPGSKLVLNPFDFKTAGGTTASQYSNRPTLPLNLGYLNAASQRTSRELSDMVMLYKAVPGATGGIAYGWRPSIGQLDMWQAGLPDQQSPEDLLVEPVGDQGVKLSVSANANPVWQAIYTKDPITVDLDETSTLEVSVSDVAGMWSLKVNDGVSEYVLQSDTGKDGTLLYDLRQITGWSGTKSFRVYLFAIGQGASATFSKLQILHVEQKLAGAASYSTEWTPTELPFQASYQDGSSIQGADFLYDENTVVRSASLAGAAPGSSLYVGGKYNGSVAWADGVLTIDQGGHAAAIAINGASAATAIQYYASESDLLADINALDQAPAQGFWLLELSADALPAGKLIVAAALAAGDDKESAADWAQAPLTADLQQVRAAREAYWDAYLASVPQPASFEMPTIMRKGVASADVKHDYYAAWVLLAQNVLPSEAAYPYPQIATGKASLWDEGEPTNPFTASWDSLMGIQLYAYVDPDTAWNAFRGLMSLVQEDGQLGGESLPSRKAQTALILYKVTGNLAHLQEVYPALTRYLNWRIDNPRWIYGTHDNPNERDAEFVVSAMMDIKRMEEIADILGLPADRADWEAKRLALFEQYKTWFWPTTSSLPSQYYDVGTGSRAGGNPIWVTTGLYVDELQGTYSDTMLQLFDSYFDPSQSFAGFVNPKQPDWGYTIYGLIAKGQVEKASQMVQIAMRDIVRTGNFFSESYTNDNPPLPAGVRPSLFGISQMIENVLLRNGFDYDKGTPSAVRLLEGTVGVSGLHVQGKTLNILIDGDNGLLTATGSYIGGTRALPIAGGETIALTYQPSESGEGGGGDTQTGNGSVGGTTGTIVTVKDGRSVVEVEAGRTLATIPFAQLEARELLVQFGAATVLFAESEVLALQSQASKAGGAALIVELAPDADAAKNKPAVGEGSAAAKFAGDAYRFRVGMQRTDGSESEVQLQNGAAVTLPYEESGIDEELLGVYAYDEATGRWNYIGGRIDRAANAAIVQLTANAKLAVLEYRKSFADVPQSHWAARVVQVLAARHIASGVSDERFEPSRPATRAEFMALLVKALELPKTDTTLPFVDAKEGAWYMSDLSSAFAAGLIQGTEGGALAPDASLTREEMATLLVRALGILQGNAAASAEGDQAAQATQAAQAIRDRNEVSSWAKENVSKALAEGLMRGKGSGLFDPHSLASRAETAQAVWNLLNR